MKKPLGKVIRSLGLVLLGVVLTLIVAWFIPNDFDEPWGIGVACFAQEDIRELQQVDKVHGEFSEESISVTFQMVIEGRCVSTAFFDADWELGNVVDGIRSVSSYPYPHVALEEVLRRFADGDRPKKQHMYFFDFDINETESLLPSAEGPRSPQRDGFLLMREKFEIVETYQSTSL